MPRCFTNPSFKFLNYKMENNKFRKEQTSVPCTSQDKDLLSNSDDSSEEVKELSEDALPDFLIPSEINYLENPGVPKESYMHLYSTCVTAATSDLDDSFEVVSDSSSTTECAANTRRRLRMEQDTDASESKKDSIAQLDSSNSYPRSNINKESNRVLPESANSLNFPAIQKPNFETSDNLNVSKDVAPKKVSHHQLQSQNIKSRRVSLAEGEIFVMEMSDEEFSDYEKVSTTSFKCERQSTDGFSYKSTEIKQKFASDSSTTFVEYNPQNNSSENFELQRRNTDNANVRKNKITNPSAEITGVIPKETLGGDIEDNVYYSTANSTSSTEENNIQKSMFFKEDFSNKTSSSMTRNEVDSTNPLVASKTAETSNETSKEAFEILNRYNVGLSESQKVKTHKGREWMELKISDTGSYNSVYYARISDLHIIEVLKRMMSNCYSDSENEDDRLIYGYCKYLFEKGCKVKVVNDEQGALHKTYPPQFIVPYANHIPTLLPKVFEELTIKSSEGTCRDRFVARTIICDKQFICRSAALKVREPASHETETRSSETAVVKGDRGSSKLILKHVRVKSEYIRDESTEKAQIAIVELEESEKHRSDGTNCSRVLQITDLMGEVSKKKLWISLSSSENTYEEFNTEFDIIKMPFPDCEFFRQYKEAGKIPDGLLWNESTIASDIVSLTQSYIETILTHLMQGKANIVIHCISGCDQSSLFIALLRILLWADRVIHIALTADEIAYLTLAYDWYISGHNLSARVKHGEEILHFCYNILDYFVDERFSPRFIENKSFGRIAPFRALESKQRRVRCIREVKEIVLALYDDLILNSQ